MLKTRLKCFSFFCFKVYAWKCVVSLPSPNTFKSNDVCYFFNITLTHTHNYTQKQHSIWIP
jgi:hypothetical protein